MAAVPLTPEHVKKRLWNKALHYLGRYASNSARLHRILQTFAGRRLEGAEPSIIAAAIEDVVSNCHRLGYIDDAAFARQRIRSGRQAGLSARAIHAKLLAAGIGRQQADEAIKHSQTHKDEDSAELAAALIHARKRRLGPYDPAPERPYEKTQKHMARMARAGFSLDTARQVLSLRGAEEAENLAAQINADNHQKPEN